MERQVHRRGEVFHISHRGWLRNHQSKPLNRLSYYLMSRGCCCSAPGFDAFTSKGTIIHNRNTNIPGAQGPFYSILLGLWCYYYPKAESKFVIFSVLTRYCRLCKSENELPCDLYRGSRNKHWGAMWLIPLMSKTAISHLKLQRRWLSRCTNLSLDRFRVLQMAV